MVGEVLSIRGGEFEGGSRRSFINSRGVVGEVLSIRSVGENGPPWLRACTEKLEKTALSM